MVISAHEPVALAEHGGGEQRPLSDLSGASVGAFSATGNPEAFGATLRSLGADVIYSRRFPDHHIFTNDEVDDVCAEAAERGAQFAVMTEKDAVKVMPRPTRALPIFVLGIEIKLLDGADALWAQVEGALRQGIRPEDLSAV